MTKVLVFSFAESYDLDIAIMSKRRADSSIQSQSKKVKREPREPSPPTASVAGSAYSVRQVAVLTLTTLAIKSFSRGLLKLVTEENYADTAASLKALPEHLLLRVLSQLAEAWPGRMTHEFIVEVRYAQSFFERV